MRVMEVSDGLVDASELCISRKMADPLPLPSTAHPVNVDPVIDRSAVPVSVTEMAPPFDAVQRVKRESVIESVFDEASSAETAAPFPEVHFRSVTLQLPMVAEALDWIVMAGVLKVIVFPDVEDS